MLTNRLLRTGLKRPFYRRVIRILTPACSCQQGRALAPLARLTNIAVWEAVFSTQRHAHLWQVIATPVLSSHHTLRTLLARTTPRTHRPTRSSTRIARTNPIANTSRMIKGRLPGDTRVTLSSHDQARAQTRAGLPSSTQERAPQGVARPGIRPLGRTPCEDRALPATVLPTLGLPTTRPRTPTPGAHPRSPTPGAAHTRSHTPGAHTRSPLRNPRSTQIAHTRKGTAPHTSNRNLSLHRVTLPTAIGAIPTRVSTVGTA